MSTEVKGENALGVASLYGTYCLMILMHVTIMHA